MSADKKLTVFACNPGCDAGGPERDGGHKFTVDFMECLPSGAVESGYRCEKCGMSNISYFMWAGE